MHSQAFDPCTQSFNIFITQRGTRHYDKSLLLLPKAPGNQWLPVCLDRLPVPDSISMPASPWPSTGFFHSARPSPGGLCTRTVRTSVHSWLKAPWDQYVCWWLDRHLGSVKHHGHLCPCFAVNMFYLFVCLFKKTLRAEWQGRKRSSCLTFSGAGKLFFLLCISSNNVWGLQCFSILSDACPSLPFQTRCFREWGGTITLICTSLVRIVLSIFPRGCWPFAYLF